MRNLVEKIKIWHFLVIFLVTAPTSVWLLRQNNLTMIELRDEVVRVDTETGNLNKIEPELEELRAYVFSHMNTNLGSPVELIGAYNTEVEKRRKRAEQSGSANSDVYSRAIEVCEDPSVLLTVRAQCIQDYVTRNAKPGSDPQELVFPDKALYSYNFASPLWSPDLAGFGLLISALSFVSLVVLVTHRLIGPLLGRWIDRDPLE